MTIDLYSKISFLCYTGIFLIAFIGFFAAVIRKKWRQYLWLPGCAAFYTIHGSFSLMAAFSAYEDFASPNYLMYENWGLKDFVLNDVKTLVVWICIGVICYFAFCRGITLLRKLIYAALIMLGLMLAFLILVNWMDTMVSNQAIMKMNQKEELTDVAMSKMRA